MRDFAVARLRDDIPAFELDHNQRFVCLLVVYTQEALGGEAARRFAGRPGKHFHRSVMMLWESMGKGVVAHVFVDVEQPSQLPGDLEAHAQARLQAWVDASWPFGAPHPEIHCDRRALLPGPPWASLHAKCVAVDGERAYVSSANFTARGQERNIEAGVLLHDPTFAAQLERQWLGLVGAGLVVTWRPR